jgi:hypothetical protein
MFTIGIPKQYLDLALPPIGKSYDLHFKMAAAENTNKSDLIFNFKRLKREPDLSTYELWFIYTKAIIALGWCVLENWGCIYNTSFSF